MKHQRVSSCFRAFLAMFPALVFLLATGTALAQEEPLFCDDKEYVENIYR